MSRKPYVGGTLLRHPLLGVLEGDPQSAPDHHPRVNIPMASHEVYRSFSGHFTVTFSSFWFSVSEERCRTSVSFPKRLPHKPETPVSKVPGSDKSLFPHPPLFTQEEEQRERKLSEKPMIFFFLMQK